MPLEVGGEGVSGMVVEQRDSEGWPLLFHRENASDCQDIKRAQLPHTWVKITRRETGKNKNGERGEDNQEKRRNETLSKMKLRP